MNTIAGFDASPEDSAQSRVPSGELSVRTRDGYDADEVVGDTEAIRKDGWPGVRIVGVGCRPRYEFGSASALVSGWARGDAVRFAIKLIYASPPTAALSSSNQPATTVTISPARRTLGDHAAHAQGAGRQACPFSEGGEPCGPGALSYARRSPGARPMARAGTQCPRSAHRMQYTARSERFSLGS